MAKDSINDEELDIIKELQKLDPSEVLKLDPSERFKYIYEKVPSLQKYHLKKGIKVMVKDPIYYEKLHKTIQELQKLDPRVSIPKDLYESDKMLSHEEYNRKKGIIIIEFEQQQMLLYDKEVIKREQMRSEQPKRTIAEVEDRILHQWGGKKLDLEYFYQHLEDFFGTHNPFEYVRMLSPCKIIYHYTEEVIPDDYFVSFYFIPLQDNQKKVDDFYKELVMYIASRDGKNVYAAGLLTPMIIGNKELSRRIEKELCYYQEGIGIYFEDINTHADVMTMYDLVSR